MHKTMILSFVFSTCWFLKGTTFLMRTDSRTYQAMRKTGTISHDYEKKNKKNI